MTPLPDTAPIQGVAPEPYPYALSQEAKTAIDAIIDSRILISFRDLNACFKLARGIGIGRHTLREWETEGMPVHHHSKDRYYFYRFYDVWAWYSTRGASHTTKPSSAITAQSWAPRR